MDEFVRLTGLSRGYASRALRSEPKVQKPSRPHKRGRRTVYDAAVKSELVKIWELLDFINAKRLAAAMPDILAKLKALGELDIHPDVESKLIKISPATIDRLLKDTRHKMGRRGDSTTRRSSYLIDQIPIKTFGEWNDVLVGYLQLDLVAHSAGNVYGGFAHTLNATDVATGWTSSVLVRSKTKFEMLKALIAIRKRFPFPIKGFHTDNGAEFINEICVKFANRYGLKFTRGRPYKKNDNSFVEQKNYSVVRRNTGYLRYDQPEHFG